MAPEKTSRKSHPPDVIATARDQLPFVVVSVTQFSQAAPLMTGFRCRVAVRVNGFPQKRPHVLSTASLRVPDSVTTSLGHAMDVEGALCTATDVRAPPVSPPSSSMQLA